MSYLEKIKPSAIFAIALAVNVIMQPSYPAVFMFIGFLAADALSNHLDLKRASEVKFNYISQILERLEKIDTAVEALNSDVESVTRDHTEAHRILEESKSLLSQNRLASALNSKAKRL